jgi:hypothetical protein
MLPVKSYADDPACWEMNSRRMMELKTTQDAMIMMGYSDRFKYFIDNIGYPHITSKIQPLQIHPELKAEDVDKWEDTVRKVIDIAKRDCFLENNVGFQHILTYVERVGVPGDQCTPPSQKNYSILTNLNGAIHQYNRDKDAFQYQLRQRDIACLKDINTAKVQENQLDSALRRIEAKKRELEEKIAQVEALKKKADSVSVTSLPPQPRIGQKRCCPGCRIVVAVEIPLNQSTFDFKCPMCNFTERTNCF